MLHHSLVVTLCCYACSLILENYLAKLYTCVMHHIHDIIYIYIQYVL